jgi:Mg-chelatase subunit ChlI
MNELLVVVIRYGSYTFLLWLANRGIIQQDEVKGLTDQIINLLPGLAAVGIPIWAGIVRFGTRPVMEATANRTDVPTVNPLTGVKETAASRTGKK